MAAGFAHFGKAGCQDDRIPNAGSVQVVEGCFDRRHGHHDESSIDGASDRTARCCRLTAVDLPTFRIYQMQGAVKPGGLTIGKGDVGPEGPLGRTDQRK